MKGKKRTSTIAMEDDKLAMHEATKKARREGQCRATCRPGKSSAEVHMKRKQLKSAMPTSLSRQATSVPTPLKKNEASGSYRDPVEACTEVVKFHVDSAERKT